MISNTNESKKPSESAYLAESIKKYVGVASVNIVAVNPNNATLRKYGWEIPDEADEPNYVVTKTDDSGRQTTSARVRLLAQIQELDSKPIIPLDFWVNPNLQLVEERTDADGSVRPAKCKIIDAFVQTAWATKEELQAKKIPQYKNGPARISPSYHPCHVGEEELSKFIYKYLNITPLQVFDRIKKAYVESKNPGQLTIDNWKKLCAGDVSEIKEYLSTQPDNRLKVVLGIRNTDDNKTYQTFLTTDFIGNGSRPDFSTGEYTRASKLINEYYDSHPNSNYTFDARPVHEWVETATAVTDASAQTYGNVNVSEVNAGIDDLPF